MTHPPHPPAANGLAPDHAGHDYAAAGGWFGERTELYFAAASGVFWVAGFVLALVTELPAPLGIGLYAVAILLGGYYATLEAYQGVRSGRFEIDFLMIVAAAGAAALGRWGEAALLLFLFSLGHALEHYAMARARKSIAALSELAPATALLRGANGDTREVKVEELRIGDTVVVKPNTKIPADGVVISGSGAVDQSAITGESVPVEKLPVREPNRALDLATLPAEHRTFSGTVNGGSALEVRVLKPARDSTLAKLVELVQEAEHQKSPTQHLTDRFERYYVPAVLLLVSLLLLAFLVLDETFQESFYRAMSVLVAASPCALAISTPSAVLAGVARAAQKGVLIKGGRPLEDLGRLTAMAFDKTGTLTEGRPRLTAVLPANGIPRRELLTTAVAVEELSDHPLSAAIVEGGEAELGGLPDDKATGLEALTARGIRARYRGATVHIGNRRLLREVTGRDVPADIDRQMQELETAGHTAMLVHRGDTYLGIVAVMDVARTTAKSTLSTLRRMGIRRLVMLTGDNQRVANAIAGDIGITDPLGSLLPEEKVAAIHRLNAEEGRVAMVGDGVNDAPAMASSTVGVAMGAAGSDVALETADVALMADRLDNLPFAIGLSRAAHRIIRQNLWISLGVVAILVPLTLLGIASLGPAVIAHEGSTMVVVLNALRLLAYDRV